VDYVNTRASAWKWVLRTSEFDNPTIDDIQNNVVLVFQWASGQLLAERIYDSEGEYIDYSMTSLIVLPTLDNNGTLVGIIKEETPSNFVLYPRYWGTHSSS
jgi:hypothetical protein